MNDFLTPDMLANYAIAVAVVVGIVNFILAWQPARPYAKPIAFAVALVIVLAARGLPRDFAQGVAAVVNALLMAITALGSNTVITDTLAARQPQTRGIALFSGVSDVETDARPARFWRRW